MENVTAVYVKMENRPGALERISRVFQERRTNIEAIMAETSGPAGYVRILSPKPREMVDLLRQNGIEAYESETVVASVPNKPGEFFRVSADLAAAGINLEAVLTTPDGKLAFRTSDNERAAQILRKL
ncbi:MAG TPA: ACT domain-containing protein [Candidatus Thermoplasmatota archaeon]|nr:ACT domain-containing protein [Candidatus Thermoplasmatota archaeon]